MFTSERCVSLSRLGTQVARSKLPSKELSEATRVSQCGLFQTRYGPHYLCSGISPHSAIVSLPEVTTRLPRVKSRACRVYRNKKAASDLKTFPNPKEIGSPATIGGKDSRRHIGPLVNPDPGDKASQRLVFPPSVTCGRRFSLQCCASSFCSSKVTKLP